MSSLFDMISERLGYVLSLPERSLRSLASIVGGSGALLTETLFPESLRGTTLYKVFIGDTQQFLIRRVAQVQQEGQAQGEGAAAGDASYVSKKMVGGALETAGLFAMHFSPVWVFAIAGDAAAGSSAFLHRLVEQLRRNGVLAPDAQVRGLDDLLAAMQDSTRRSTTAINTPPLSYEELGKLADEMTASYGQMFARAKDLLPRFQTLWQRMEELARRENISLERLQGILTVDVAAWGKKGIGSVLAVGQTSTGLFGEKILESYAQTLDHITEEGVTSYVNQRMKPFLQAAAAHFDPARKTWTETLWGGKGSEGEQPAAVASAPAEQTGPSEAQPPPAAGS